MTANDKDFKIEPGRAVLLTDKHANDNDVPTVVVTVKYLYALRQAVGLHIDPETAEVWWTYAQTFDPYGDHLNLPEEYQQLGREYFARSPGSKVSISFGDLPEATRDALWKKRMERQGISYVADDAWDEVPF
jgi:hypothetical protein